MNINDGYTGLETLVDALGTAVNMRFMAAEHASSIWKEQIKLAGIDISKKVVITPKEEGTIIEKVDPKGGEASVS